MRTADQALETLKSIRTSFADFCTAHGKVTEADTRANIIDKILTGVLNWPDQQIQREKHVKRGYMDYCLNVRSKRYVTVEAKAEGVPFLFPIADHHRFMKLSGSLLTSKEIKEAIEQVRGYCDDAGIRYAVATNGYPTRTLPYSTASFRSRVKEKIRLMKAQSRVTKLLLRRA